VLAFIHSSDLSKPMDKENETVSFLISFQLRIGGGEKGGVCHEFLADA
jgi:hypothetical protein